MADRLRLPWTATEIHLLDFEGGALSGILEYGVVTVREGAVAAVRSRCCRPLGRIPAREAETHGLNREATAGQPPFSDDWEWFAGLRVGGVLGAHFAGVEAGLLRAVWPFPRLSPDWLRPGRLVADWGPWIDTANLAGAVLPPGSARGLEAVVRAVGGQARLESLAERYCPTGRRGYHRALYDTLAAWVILDALAREPDGAPWSLGRVLALSAGDPLTRAARQQTELSLGEEH